MQELTDKICDCEGLEGLKNLYLKIEEQGRECQEYAELMLENGNRVLEKAFQERFIRLNSLMEDYGREFAKNCINHRILLKDKRGRATFLILLMQFYILLFLQLNHLILIFL